MGRSSKRPLRGLSHLVQASALRGTIVLLRRLGPVHSSNLGGWIARHIGPMLPVSRIADDNLRRALPELSAAERARVIRKVWDNLGRNSAELPHLSTINRSPKGPGWEIEGEEHIADIRASGARALFFSGHLGNWEMILPIAAKLGLSVSGFYRAASNTRTDIIIQSLREEALGGQVSMFAKGPRGARAALAHLEAGGSLGLLVDQKMNDGIAIPFFGRAAMTAPALAQFAIRFRAPIVPIRIVRLGSARFRMVCEPPLAITLTGDRKADTYAILLAMNATLERWIREEPSSWLWLHRRWPNASAALP
ncbi:MAG: lauroyl acyltransferase, partial [Acetobacteraceae bacterium]